VLPAFSVDAAGPPPPPQGGPMSQVGASR
jgi:hypothetical protein